MSFRPNALTFSAVLLALTHCLPEDPSVLRQPHVRLLLHEIGRRCKDKDKGRLERWEAHLDELDGEIGGETWVRRFGIIPEAGPVLRLLAEMNEPMSEEDMTAHLRLDGPASAGQVARVIRWADRLQYVRQEAEATWGIDAVVRRVVTAG